MRATADETRAEGGQVALQGGAPAPGPLFRTEVVEYQAAHRQWGSIVALRPVGARTQSWLALVAAGFALLFVATAEYARKQPVSGYLRPAKGLARIFPQQPGIVAAVHVREGDDVRTGQPLLTVETPQVSAGGRDLLRDQLATLTAQREAIARQIRAEEVRTEAERKRLNALVEGQRREVDLLGAQVRRQEERIALGRGLLSSAQALAGRGVIADADLKRRQQELLDQERLRDDLAQQLASRGNQLAETRSALEQLPTVRAALIQGLRNDLAWVDQRLAETEGRQAYVLTAPIAGRVATVQAIPGQPADPRQLQMTIVPPGEGLQAELLVPSRAAGFVAPGQPVRIRYEAYPYQKYGTYGGRVAAVAGTAIRPQEFAGPLSLAEPAYRVEVALDAPGVRVDGRTVALRPDMTLSADIVLERRTILEWLLAPVHASRNAIDADPLVRTLRGWGAALRPPAEAALTRLGEAVARGAKARGDGLAAARDRLVAGFGRAVAAIAEARRPPVAPASRKEAP